MQRTFLRNGIGIYIVLIQTYNFYLLTGVFRPFIFNAIHSIGFKSTIFILQICYFFFPASHLFNGLFLVFHFNIFIDFLDMPIVFIFSDKHKQAYNSIIHFASLHHLGYIYIFIISRIQFFNFLLNETTLLI